MDITHSQINIPIPKEQATILNLSSIPKVREDAKFVTFRIPVNEAAKFIAMVNYLTKNCVSK